MNTQQLITEIENKIQEIRTLISNYKAQITQHEYILNSLIKKLLEIKNTMKDKNISPLDSKPNTK